MNKSTNFEGTVRVSQLLWGGVVLVIFGAGAYFKHSHTVVPGTNWDAGWVLGGVLFFGGLFASMFYGAKRDVTNDLVARGLYKKAAVGLRKGLAMHEKIGPRSRDYINDLVVLARCCRETEQFADGVEFATKALDVLRSSEEAWANTSAAPRTLSSESAIGASEEIMRSFAALRPEALFELGANKYELKKYSDAEKALNDCIAAYSSIAEDLQKPEERTNQPGTDAFAGLAGGLELIRREERFRLQVAALFEVRKAYTLLARICDKAGKEDDVKTAESKAARALRQIVDLVTPRLSAAAPLPQDYLARANCYLALLEYDKAIADFNQALKLNPPKDLRYALTSNRGECFNRMGKLDNALEDFTAALSINPTYGLALLNRAEVYDKRKQHDLAAKDKARAESLGYQHPRLMF